MASMTRGSLPASVYWRRRFFVLGLAAVLVFLVASGLGRVGDGGSSPDAMARQAGAQPNASGEPTTARDDDTPGRRNRDRPRNEPNPKPLPASPVGSCVDSDVRVSPTVDSAVAGQPVTLRLELRTLLSEACTWRVSSDHLTVKVTSGTDDIWSTRECPATVPVRDVVVRRDVTSTLDLTWNARRSDDGCPGLTEWARSGFYYVDAAALGGEPADVQFELRAPSPEVIVREPKDKGQQDRKQKQKQKDRNGGGSQPGDGAPSGAVEPN